MQFQLQSKNSNNSKPLKLKITHKVKSQKEDFSQEFLTFLEKVLHYYRRIRRKISDIKGSEHKSAKFIILVLVMFC